jgi:hypothetical protein
MSLIVKAPRPWSDAKWDLLPNLRVPVHRDGYGGWEVSPLTWRCEHGVYLNPSDELVQDWSFQHDPEGELVIAWHVPYCEVCSAEFVVCNTFAEWVEKFFRPIKERRRALKPGEIRYREDKLFDSRPVYPEIFTRPILLRGRTQATDLRLQEDPETGKPRLETAGGYITASFGYSRAGRRHGLDSDAENIQMSWLAEHHGSAVGHPGDDPKSTPWSAALPDVRTTVLLGLPGITPENWMPYSWPIHRGPVQTNTRNVLIEEEEATTRAIRVKDPAPAVRWANTLKFVISPGRFVKKPRPSAAIVRYVPPRVWPFSVSAEQPTAKQLAAWRRKRENQRDGGKHMVPLRRTKRWPDNWRTSRPMRDLAARLDMYTYGEDGLIDVKRMCAKAWENLREAQTRKKPAKNTFWPPSPYEREYRSSLQEVETIVGADYGRRKGNHTKGRAHAGNMPYFLFK